ncbi:MAG: cystathionine beta-lyase [Arcticibacterium sp.]|jgi:cystathionine beta-lyase
MTYNFDQPTNRENNNSIKWSKFPKNILPLWIADMDFESPIEIKEALQKLIEHQIYGYAGAPAELYDVIIERLEKRHHWKIKKEWIVLLPGLVPGLHASARIFESRELEILTSIPVYFHLSLAGKYAGAPTSEVPFIWQNDRWEMDFETMQKQVKAETKVYMLCNPHNPNGRVFTKPELEKLSAFCLKNNLVLVSDEIHCDLVLDKTATHISVASINKEIEQRSITLLAPSKTFNIAGLGGSMAIIPNDDLRKRFQDAGFGIMPHMNAFACQSMMAAYKYGEAWRSEMVNYLKANHDYLMTEINKISSLTMKPLEATYLAWIHCDRADITDLETYLFKFGLGVSGGHQFKGNAYFRLNFGTQRKNLELAVERLKKAFV